MSKQSRLDGTVGMFPVAAEEPQVEAWFDGAVEPVNPGGHATYGIAVNVLGKPVCRRSGYVGFGPKMSNNVAEYAGFTAALTEAVKHDGPILMRGDSLMVVKQMSGSLKDRSLTNRDGKELLYVPYYHIARDLLLQHRERVRVEWIPREENAVTDALSKEELRKRGVTLRIQSDNTSAMQEDEAQQDIAVAEESAIPAMPAGVRLIAWNPKPGPVQLSPCSTVVNVLLFVATTLRQLDMYLKGKNYLDGGWGLGGLLGRLATCGCTVELIRHGEEG